jgi:hypothetical protein
LAKQVINVLDTSWRGDIIEFVNTLGYSDKTVRLIKTQNAHLTPLARWSLKYLTFDMSQIDRYCRLLYAPSHLTPR